MSLMLLFNCHWRSGVAHFCLSEFDIIHFGDRWLRILIEYKYYVHYRCNQRKETRIIVRPRPGNVLKYPIHVHAE